MAPRQDPAGAWHSFALDSPNVSEASLARVRQLAAAQGVDGAKVFKAGSALPEGRGSTFYPLFVSAIVAGLVPPFSEFFFSVLCHYNLQALHLHPNSVLLLAIFAYYCEAHVGGEALSGPAAPLLLPPALSWFRLCVCELRRVRQLHRHFEYREKD